MSKTVKLEHIGDFEVRISDLVKMICGSAAAVAMTNEELSQVRDCMNAEMNYRENMAKEKANG